MILKLEQGVSEGYFFPYLLRMFVINSLDHMFGTRRYYTPDTSRNNALLALITLGEGWHNNDHHYMVSARQGFRWWEIDITYMLLKLMDRVGVVRDLRPLPERLRSG